jgi:hypothetical protein
LEGECDGREKEGEERLERVEMTSDRMVMKVDFEVASASG